MKTAPSNQFGYKELLLPHWHVTSLGLIRPASQVGNQYGNPRKYTGSSPINLFWAGEICLDRAQGICKARLRSALAPERSGQLSLEIYPHVWLHMRVEEQGKTNAMDVQKAVGEPHQPGHSNPSQGAWVCRGCRIGFSRKAGGGREQVQARGSAEGNLGRETLWGIQAPHGLSVAPRPWLCITP